MEAEDGGRIKATSRGRLTARPTSRPRSSEIRSRARAEKTGSRAERRQTQNISESLGEDGRRQRRGRGVIGNRPEREDSPAVLSEGHGCIGKLVTTV